MKIYIVNSSTFAIYFPDLEEKLKKLGDLVRIWVGKNISGEKLAKETKDADYIVASVTPRYTEEFFNKQNKVKLISRHGIGYDNIDIKKATKEGVIITKVFGDVEREAVAEFSITLILSCARKLSPSFEAVKEGKWMERKNFVGYQLLGKRAGIIGLGNIGSRVCEILKYGFNMDIVAYDPNLTKDEIEKRGAKRVELDELLSTSDIISIHASHNESNYHLLGKKEFSLMKKGVILVNTARGELMDEKSLIESIEEGKIFAVGLDVIEGEPIDEKSPLLKYKNVFVSPHTSAYTYETLRGMDEKMVNDIRAVYNGKIPKEIVNPEVLMRENRARINI